MKRLRSALFLALCFSLGVLLTVGFQHMHSRVGADPTTTVGVGDAPPLRGFSLASFDRPSLNAFPALHATAVSVAYSDDASALAAFVTHAHKLHLKVVLLPPNQLAPANPFPKPLDRIAADAQAAGVDVLCISWLNADPDPDFWQPQIAAVRKIFFGRILLAATPELLPGIEFWDKVDLVGAIGPFDLPIRTTTRARNMQLGDVRAAWACYLDSLESLAFRYGKRLVILNVSVAPTAQDPTPDFPASVYEALVTETKGRLGTEGVFMQWQPGPPKIADENFVNHYPSTVSRIGELWLPTAPAATVPTPKTEVDDTDPDQ